MIEPKLTHSIPDIAEQEPAAPGLAPRRASSAGRAVLVVALLITSASILGWLVFRERDVLLAYDWRVRWDSGLIAAGLYTVALIVSVWVWAGIMRTLGARLPLTWHWYYISLSNLAKRLPGTVWYVIGRAQFYRRHGVPSQATSLGSVIEMGASSVAGVLVSAMFAGPIMAHYGVSWVWLIPVLAAGVLALHPTLLTWLLRRSGVQAEQIRLELLLRWVIAHVLVWLTGGGMFLAIVSMFVDVSLSNWGYVIGSWALVGTLSTLVLLLPSNLGITEVGLSLLLAGIIPGPIAVLAALSVRLLTIVFEISWAVGVLALFRPRHEAP